MPTTPQGALSLSIDYLRQLVAASAAFVAWTGAANPTAALDRVHHTALPRPTNGVSYSATELQALRPFAIADVERMNGFERRRVAESAYEDSGTLILYFEDNIAGGDLDDYQTAETKFANQVGLVLDDMAAISGQPGFLTIHRFGLADGPHRSSLDESTTAGDYHVVAFRIDWGS